MSLMILKIKVLSKRRNLNNSLFIGIFLKDFVVCRSIKIR